MKNYDLIIVGTGSATSILDAIIQENPEIKIAVIDKDEPGGICLTRGCIPSKILIYVAELVRTIERAREFGVDVDLRKIDFEAVMNRMRTLIYRDINLIRTGLSRSPNVDYYPTTTEFSAPYTMRVGDNLITSKMIFLCTGSKPIIPPIKGLDEVSYYTSDTILKLDRLPESLVVIGGGYIAAEYSHFFSAMGSKVTVIGRNPQFLPEEEPEVSALAKRELQKHMTVITNYEVLEVEKPLAGVKKVTAINRADGKRVEVTAEEILIAAGRGANTDIIHPERSMIRVDEKGWFIVNEYLETSQPNVYALGDADGKYPFKHKANYEAAVVYYNAILGKKVKADYHAIPHAVFTYPEVASVGLGEKEALEKYGKDKILIGIHRYEDTAKGEAMNVRDCFFKVIVETETLKILGAHVIGPYASVLIQEAINLMYTPEQTAEPIIHGMHIHPALSEVVEGAFRSLMVPDTLDVTEEEYDRRMGINVKGVFLCSQAVLKVMVSQKNPGKIINFASQAGLFPFPDSVLYDTAKAAIVGLTRSLACDFGYAHIHVNCIAPGLTSGIDEPSRQGERMRAYARIDPMGRGGLPEDQARLALYLASADSDYVSGQIIACDGGMSAQSPATARVPWEAHLARVEKTWGKLVPFKPGK